MARSQNKYTGMVVDAATKEPLPFVNIGIIDKATGTVSDESGHFILSLRKEDFSKNDTLLFSSLGYHTVKMSVVDLESGSSAPMTIAMRPGTIVLDEIIVSSKGVLREIKTEIAGYGSKGKEVYGYWKDNVALGGELATKIKIRKGIRLLKDFSFTVLENPSDSLLVRLNIYKGDSRFPETKLTQKDITFSIDIASGTVRIDLEPYKIYVEDDFVVALELLRVYGDEIGLVILGSETPGVSYTRYVSQDKWRKLRSTMAWELNTAVLDYTD